MQKNDVVTLTIESLTNEGNGLGRIDGLVVFVPFTAVGDVVEIKLLKVSKNCAYGKVEQLLERSPNRIAMDCPAFGRCGGCSYRHISYSAELTAKEKNVRDAFERIGKLSPEFLPIIPNEEVDGYRNKAQFPIGKDADGNIISGFYSGRSHRIAPCTDCRLQPPVFAEILKFTLDYIKEHRISVYDEATHLGVIRHLCIRRGYRSGEINVCVVAKRKAPEAKKLGIAIGEAFKDVVGVVLNINRPDTNVILGDEEITVYGTPEIIDEMSGCKFAVSPKSFYQVNTKQAEWLYAIAAEYAEPDGKTIIDLYCGAGTIGLSMAKRAKKIIGVEIVPSAIENAKRNAVLNSADNAEFICGDTGFVTTKLVAEGLRADVVVLDPARKGCDKQALDNAVALSPERIVMVSCNPATAARDCAILAEAGYSVLKVQAVDMFSRTAHVETVVLLSKLNTKQHIDIELKTDELDLTSSESKATYDKIKTYVKEHAGLSVSSLYIAQVKQKCGIIERENFNKAKSEDAKQPKCPKDKEMAIKNALKYFKMI